MKTLMPFAFVEQSPTTTALGPLLWDEVHVWRVPTEMPASRVHLLHALLDASEAEKARRFHFDRDRNLYIVAHGMLKVVLSHYLDNLPSELRFYCNPFGKPHLLMAAANRINFNLSHSGHMAVLALATGREVGVDVEQIRVLPEVDTLAAHVLSAPEATFFQHMSQTERHHAFYKLWTRKEAYVKGRGRGLSLPMNRCTVMNSANSLAQLVADEDFPEQVGQWLLKDIPLGAGYAGALALQGHCSRAILWNCGDMDDSVITG